MNSPEQKKIVRFAPSPTGHLHIGGARTALFNYLFSKNHGGIFILRIEDTDTERSSKEMVDEIILGLKWLGIDWDKGPVFQSDRIEKYREAIDVLLDGKKAYRCFCSREEIKKRSVVDGKIISYMYDRHCLSLTEKEIKRKLREKAPFVVRFLVPGGNTKFKDKIHKEVKTKNSEIEDFVLLRSDGQPTYQLSVVVDDSEMGITDIIRGDDHISNTFKQIMLFKALGKQIPKYTHLPLVLGKDKKKLSKRHGETSVLEFKRKGYLPEALTTYFSQLSWNPGDSKKIFKLSELEKSFDFSKISKNSPIFDYDKLLFLNSRAIRDRKAEEIINILFKNAKTEEEFKSVKSARLYELVELVKPRIKLLTDFLVQFRIYLFGKYSYDSSVFESVKIDKTIVKCLVGLIGRIGKVKEFNSANIETELRIESEIFKIEARDLIHPCRYALTGTNVSPPIFDVFSFFGREESVKRLNNFVDFIKKNVFSY